MAARMTQKRRAWIDDCQRLGVLDLLHLATSRRSSAMQREDARSEVFRRFDELRRAHSLSVDASAVRALLDHLRRQLARLLHSDRGAPAGLMVEVNAVLDEALRGLS